MKTKLFRLLALMSVATLRAEISTFDISTVGTCPAAMSQAVTHGSKPARWEVVADPEAHSPPHVLAQLSDEPSPERSALVVYRLVEQEDGAISVRFKPLSGKVNPAVGVIWRYRDKENYYCAQVRVSDNTLTVAKVQDGRWIPLQPVGAESLDTTVKLDTKIPFNVWSRMSVRFEGSRMSIKVNKLPGCDIEDSTFTTGLVGMCTQADTIAYFDNFEINLL